ncbi:MAG: peptide chain release factor 3 [Spirochaetales bacterium]|jgi:peptide chain release factor 3|nr:peptide chain release factor 3 [Spirochaetales bacterium]
MTDELRKEEIRREIERRLTFAIISHPDAGKTTITEKLLLFGGAIHAAGAVKSKKNTRATTSDFMQMEQERGISISTSVMGFEYRGRKVNLLDTPGHADFSEDTYRTLSAVDSALMVIDSVKGVEERTRKLCEICRMRKTPIITFMNKMDREGREPIELLDEVEEELDITVCPMSWPVGRGREFKGVYSLYEKKLIFFNPHGFNPHGRQDGDQLVEIDCLDDPRLDRMAGSLAKKLREEIELIQGVYPPFDREQYLAGLQTPVFFGSALNNFGVRELLDCFVDIAPLPRPRPLEGGREISPYHDKFSGLVFKIHANMDPRHRDRIAFMRICSGVFERNRTYQHVRSGKPYKTANPTAFMAQDRMVIDEAYPGDIIGLHDTGVFKIGDALTEGENLAFMGIPSFAPQIFKSVLNLDPLKSKQLDKGLQQLAEEGVVQLFSRLANNGKLVGVVGVLQFDVLQFRLENEYKALCRFEATDYGTACWLRCGDKKTLDDFVRRHGEKLCHDREGRLVFLARSRWMIDRTMEDEKGIEYFFTSDF